MEALEGRWLLAATLGDQVGDLYRTQGNLSLTRDGVALALAGNDVVFAGGTYYDGDAYHTRVSDVVDVYHADTGLWSTTHLSSPKNFPRTLSVGHDVLLIDGSTTASYYGSSARAIDVFNADSGQVTPLDLTGHADFEPTDAAGSQAIQLRSDGSALIWDAASGEFFTVALSHAGYPGSSVIAGGHALFFFSDVVDVYDPATRSIEARRQTLPDTATGLRYVVGDHVVFQGGAIYDITNNTWSALPSYDAPKVNWYSGTVVGTRIAFGGGGGGYFTPTTDDSAVFDLATNQWSYGKLGSPRTSIPAFTIGGKGYFINGTGYGDAAAFPVGGADYYDSATNQWVPAKLSSAPPGLDRVVVNDQAIFAGTDYGYQKAVDIFTTSNFPEPADPSLADGGGVATSPAQFTWSASEGATRYDIYLDEHLVASVPTNAWPPAAPIADGVHSWQVVARNATDFTAGPRWVFTVGAPGVVCNPSIPDGASLAVSPHVFSWNAAPGATSYDVYVNGVKRQNVIVPAVTLDAPAAGGPATWQIVARNGFTTTPGPIWHFSSPQTSVQLTTHAVPNAPSGVVEITVGAKVLIANTDRDLLNVDTARLDIYDGSTNTWSATSFPNDLGFPRSIRLDTGALFYDGEAADVYDVISGRWSVHSVPSRDGYAMTSSGPVAVIAGGSVAGRHRQVVSDRVDLYDTRTGTWSTAKLSVARRDITAVSAGGKIFLAGGSLSPSALDPHPKLSDVVDIYDTATGRWSVAHLSTTRQYLQTVVVGRYVRFFAYDGSSTFKIDVYDLRTGRWSVVADSQASRPFAAEPLITVGPLRFTAVGQENGLPPYLIDVYDTAARTDSRFALSATAQSVTAIDLGGKVLFAEDLGVIAAPQNLDIYDLATRQVIPLAPADPSGTIARAASAGPGRALVLQGTGWYYGAPITANLVTEPQSLAPLSGSLADVSLDAVTASARVTVRNTGPGVFNGPFTISVYGVRKAKHAGAAILLGRTSVRSSLAGGKSITGSMSLSAASLAPGDYQLIVAVDDGSGAIPIAASAVSLRRPAAKVPNARVSWFGA